jgi:hypothetical protein
MGGERALVPSDFSDDLVEFRQMIDIPSANLPFSMAVVLEREAMCMEGTVKYRPKCMQDGRVDRW